MDASPKARQYALRFISGKYQGGEFPIAAGREIFIGRSNDLDVVLVEDMVSRKHARISFVSDTLVIEDLGSTNGTFVNGEKIKRARLKEGDRVLIGTSIVRVAAVDSGTDASEAEARARMQQNANQRTSQVRTMSGSIEEIPLVDLLQLFTTSKKSGVLAIMRDEDVGRIYLRRGQVVYASINEGTEIGPLKSIYRLLAWERGTFELQPSDDREFAEELDLSTEAILMEGIRQIDEMNRLRDLLPPPNARLSIPKPLLPALRDLEPDELAVLQVAHNSDSLQAVLDATRDSDVALCEAIVDLIGRQYLQAG